MLWELRTEHPLLDPRLFRHRGFATGSASLMVLFIALFGIFLVMLQYLQLLLGYSALQGGRRPAADDVRDDPDLDGGRAALDAVRPEAGRRRRASRSARSASWPSPPLDAAAAGTRRCSSPQLILAVGIGLAMTPATNAIVSSLPTAKQGVASAVNDTTREIGTALGIAIMGSMFNSGYRERPRRHLGGLPGRRRRPGPGGTGPRARRRHRLGRAGRRAGRRRPRRLHERHALLDAGRRRPAVLAATYVAVRGPVPRRGDQADDALDANRGAPTTRP